jgi:flavin-dependent dehydrogenase
MTDDVVIVGAGPAGSFAALLLARAGVRVRLLDRARFPRDKLCGDTVNPGALALLGRQLDLTAIEERAETIDGMLLTGPGGVAVRGRYGPGLAGLAVTRRDFDQWLADQAVAAGARFDDGVNVVGPRLDHHRVSGVVSRTSTGGDTSVPARLVIAADGRRSRFAFAAGLARHPVRPRRWAIGAYFQGVHGLSTLGEMHVRRGHYIGVAPLGGGLANTCLVVPFGTAHPLLNRPGQLIDRRLAEDALLSPRFDGARRLGDPQVLGPMAVDATMPGRPGLLLAGDAAGFIDPMTGDGIRLALAGGDLASRVALEILNGRTAMDEGPARLRRLRRSAFAQKWGFNRALRRLVAAPSGVAAAAALARVWPGAFTAMIRYAGDCPAAR